MSGNYSIFCALVMTASVLEIVGIIIFYIFFNTLGSIDHEGQKQKLLVLTGVRDNQSA